MKQQANKLAKAPKLKTTQIKDHFAKKDTTTTTSPSSPISSTAAAASILFLFYKSVYTF